MHTEKTIQLMHFFTEKNGGTISDVKLMKLLYFTDRLSLEKTGYPLTYDDYFSMNRGPILSGAKNIIDKYSNPQYQSIFNEATPGKSPQNFNLKNVSLKNTGSCISDIDNVDFDLFSLQDREIAEAIFAKFGAMDDDAIVQYAHNPSICPEWEWPDGSRRTISLETILHKLGYSSEEANSHAASIKYFKDVVFKS
ncbi:hypothetical protein CXQ80_08090 [Pseudomonas sp. 02C 26]|uniref:Panacea domain-containing protein n=1 Tax=Pseudomonas sp. 02C 26 TaxID=2054914 RepID=UPI000C6E6102|nr:Panacea domain-containing protein [Pseudomonas sp. 02C 26]AUF95800.1 hypothetical protein CXQ80_08090 [Pseudomonas sp. 02C 26]